VDDDDDNENDDDSELLVGGIFTEYNGTATPGIARLGSDGSLAKFKTKTGFNGGVKVIVQQGKTSDLLDGSKNSGYLVGGEFTTFNGKAAPYLVRLKGNGKLDKKFTPPKLTGSVWALHVLPNGNILVGGVFKGSCDGAPHYLTGLNPDGTLNTTINDNTCGINGYVKSFAQSGDNVVIGGGFINYPGVSAAGAKAQAWVTRIQPDGTWDSSFEQQGQLHSDTYPGGYVDFVLVQPKDQAVIAGGYFTSWVPYDTSTATISTPYLIRFTDEGVVDTAFSSRAAADGFNTYLHGGALQSDGAILVAGEATSFGTFDKSPYLMRVQSTGAIDTTFAQAGTGLNGTAYNVLVQEATDDDDDDDMVLVTGAFTEYNGISVPFIARLFD